VRISRVEIENCLCFKRLALPVDASLQLLAGPNNAGKSSLVRLLETFFSDPDGEQVLPLRPATPTTGTPDPAFCPRYGFGSPT